MEQGKPNPAIERLDAFIGEWSMDATSSMLPSAVPTSGGSPKAVPGSHWDFSRPVSLGGIDAVEFGDGSS